MTKYIKPPRAADCEWRSGPPPEIGWWPADYAAYLASDDDDAGVLRFYNGRVWSLHARDSRGAIFAGEAAKYPCAYQHNIVWTDRWWEEK